MSDPLIIAGVTFLFTVLCTAVSTTWLVGRMLANRDRIFVQMMTDHELSDVKQFATVTAQIASSGESLRHEFGEVGTAIRQKMHEMETWNRDNFLRRQSFYEATKEMASDIKSLIHQVARMDVGHGGRA